VFIFFTVLPFAVRVSVLQQTNNNNNNARIYLTVQHDSRSTGLRVLFGNIPTETMSCVRQNASL
jgi:hypothetical protein